LRVDSGGGSAIASESILQECKDMPQPVICSMGNYCASGGYYIATGCKRIFALPTTITGSIGVFAVKFDLTGLAKKYGISVQHITTGPYSASYHPFQPLNPLVKNNFSREVDRLYDYFKSIVSESRGLDLKEVEILAQGKIWTGGEAKENGLIDELGGLDRAIAYARREYTQGAAEVERWPKPEGLFTLLTRILFSMEAGVLEKAAAMLRVLSADSSHSGQSQNASEYDSAKFLIQSVLEDPTRAERMHLGGVSLTMDENAALTHLITANSAQLRRPVLHPSFWN
jgi:signal peptide peptidase SppA